MKSLPSRNLALELVRVTETAAIAASSWVGHGDKNSADKSAVDAMRKMISTVHMDGTVVIGEGEKDEAPMLFNGERVGEGSGPAVVALAERGAMFDPSAVFYMEKIVCGPEAAGKIDITAPVKENLRVVAQAKGVPIEDVTVMVLDRPRHDQLSKEIREAGARIKFITDGDVAGAVMAARDDTGVDLLMGIGGTPEGIIAACAMKCLGGEIQGRLWARNEDEHRALAERGLSASQVLTTDELVRGDNCFFAATGITDGELLKGVRFDRRVVRSQSIVMRSRSKTIRIINSEHPYSSILTQ
jgi:fructose-1,6-bisphosphatase II